ncbi:MAG TPA: DUF3300 domain-containing protein [Terriglobia bacterium]|nr:DUF3300 domain-containing protein [Terriglobia bacterium]
MLTGSTRRTKITSRLIAASLAVSIATSLFTAVSFAQAPLPEAPPEAPPQYPPQELQRLVSPIALYPDPLLAQILTASTFSNDIPAAAQWADEHHYLTGDALAQAITADQVPWDPSVQALLPFPSVLDMMASDMPWTQELGNAVLAQRPDVMDAIQVMRRRAYDYGYLRSNPSIVVGMGPYITIMPANPAFVVVPAYSPAVVFAAPRIGFAVGAAIRFGFGVMIGLAFRPWGWGFGWTHFDWGHHVVIVNNHPWGRTWVNRATYVHPYAVRRYAASAPRPPERHEVQRRSPREREDARAGRAVKEEHAKAPKHEQERKERR